MVTGKILTVLKGFHHQAARQIIGITVTFGAGRYWEYPPVVAAIDAAGLYSVREHIRRRYAIIAEKLACRPIYELCVEAERMSGTSRW